MEKKLWFRAKTYGWGWYPITWQGWTITGMYTALILALAFTINEDSTTTEVAVMLILPLVILTACFIRIAYKTGEKPEWRWGKRK